MDWRLWQVWTRTVTIGELAGFTAPAVAGAVIAIAGIGPWIGYPVILAAGAVEGFCLGYAQAWVLGKRVPGLRRNVFAAATAAAAVLAYAIGLMPSTLGDSLVQQPVALLIAGSVGGGTLMLLSIGGAQWLVLRQIGLGRWWWVVVTAAAWLAGLTVFMLVATPLWQTGQPLWLTIAIGVLGGSLMAATVAALTGFAALRLMAAPSGSA